ncbi:hypothetical protein HYC85_021517 [Camellia sinensis]|uniref:BRO1 domain-containing protein n=1 Tax=Camellia sinensis TaxID=4442 RepID=A0A7J7GHW7_CAMSI|nr:hypothetical protein HYC85_021517 [Camellia sinensis]
MAAPSSSPSSTAAANIMLAIYEKKTVSVDLYRPLRNYIVFNYSEREAQNLEDDLQTLKQMRSDLERPTADSLSSRRDLLQNYFKALCAVESRFPISADKDHVNAVNFTWYDAFKTKLKASQQNIHLEKASVLFNLGAVQSQIGLTFDRSSIEGRRQGSHAFIAAAGAFAFLRDNESMKASIGGSATVDVSVECAGMLERLMLAQAQECVFENSIAKGSTPGVCAKISRQVGIYYEEALAALNVSPLKEHFDKNWLSHVQLKATLFYAEACYRYSLELHEKEEIAEEIARLKSGINALSEAKKSSSKGAAQQILDAINKLEGNLNRNLERAVKENDRVYLMRVPATSSLPPLPAFSLVKSMPMNEVLDASKDKMFASLVPDNSAKALSRYTEMVDVIIRTQAEKLQQGSELARVRLKEMDLPDSILALEGNITLPTTLKEDVEAVQISGGPVGLDAELQQLRDLRRVNHELLVQTEELLQKELTEDSQFRSQFGTRWTRPQSNTLTKNLQDRLNRFAANLKQAADSDARIERSVRDYSALMSILDRRPLKGEYAARNDRMAAYMKTANSLLAKFDHHELNQITRDQNTHANALACLASAINSEIKRTIEVGFVPEPSIGPPNEIHVNVIKSAPSWMDPIAAFLSSEQLPEDKKEAHKLRNKALRYYLDSQGGLYKKSLSGPYWECVHLDKVEELLTEIHEEIQTKRTLDIVGPLPRAQGNKRFLIVATDYFTKWVEADALIHIRDADIKRFVWRNIITRFGIPRALISDNGTQFDCGVY